MYVYTYIHIYTCIYSVCVRVRIRMIHTYILKCIYRHKPWSLTRMYPHTHTHTHTHIHMHIPSQTMAPDTSSCANASFDTARKSSLRTLSSTATLVSKRDLINSRKRPNKAPKETQCIAERDLIIRGIPVQQRHERVSVKRDQLNSQKRPNQEPKETCQASP